MITFLIIWAVVGAIVGCTAADNTNITLEDIGPLTMGFLCLLCGPLTFALYLILIILVLLSKLDKKWFR